MVRIIDVRYANDSNLNNLMLCKNNRFQLMYNKVYGIMYNVIVKRKWNYTLFFEIEQTWMFPICLHEIHSSNNVLSFYLIHFTGSWDHRRIRDWKCPTMPHNLLTRPSTCNQLDCGITYQRQLNKLNLCKLSSFKKVTDYYLTMYWLGVGNIGHWGYVIRYGYYNQSLLIL